MCRWPGEGARRCGANLKAGIQIPGPRELKGPGHLVPFPSLPLWSLQVSDCKAEFRKLKETRCSQGNVPETPPLGLLPPSLSFPTYLGLNT